jgi:glycosyltransferase involved in cell wall biosynthesis
VIPLRIGYTCHDRFPSTDTNTQQIFWTLHEMAELGHGVDLRVRALAPSDDVGRDIARHYGAPGGALPHGLRIAAARLRAHDRQETPQGRQPAEGLLSTVAFDLRAPRQFAAGTHDVLWTRDPLALVAAVRSGVAAVFETFRPDFAVARRFAPWRQLTLARVMRQAEGARHRPLPAGGLAGVIVHSRLAASAFIDAGVPPERCLTAHNGYAPALMEPELSRVEARRRLDLPEGSLVVYTGHVGPQKGTEALIALAARVPDATVAIVGVDEPSPERKWLSGRIAAASVDNVRLVPRVDLRDVAAWLYAADCLVIPPTDAPLRRYGRTVLPMKLFSYMAAGRPIVAPRLPDIEEVLCHERSALLVRPGDPATAGAAVRRVLDDPTLSARLSRAARDEARQYTWRRRAAAITAAFERWHTERP